MMLASLQAFRAAGTRSVRPRSARHANSSARRLPLAAAAQHLQQRRGVVARAASGDSVAEYEQPETAREAIDLGVQLCKSERWSEALAVFEKGLQLPGTGLKRFRDRPRLISDNEKMAVLYNIACCQGKLGDVRSGLVALSGCLELGYQDFDIIRADPDLEALKQDSRFEGLMQRFEPKAGSGGFLSGLFGRK